MNLSGKIYVAGHIGLVDQAFVRRLQSNGCNNLLSITHDKLDLTHQGVVSRYFSEKKHALVILAAARVGGFLPTQHT